VILWIDLYTDFVGNVRGLTSNINIKKFYF
jgi:hypothetical protein